MTIFEYAYLHKEQFVLVGNKLKIIWSLQTSNEKKILDQLEDKNILIVLNELGKEGWEVVAVESQKHLLKRKI